MAFGLILFCMSHTNAKTTLVDITGASSYTYDENTQNIKIYGGLTDLSASGDGVNLYDSCAVATGLVPCNKTSIYPDLALTIRFKTDASEAVTSSTVIRFKIGTGDDEITLDSDEVSTSLGVGETLFVSVPWSKICEAIDDTKANCGIDSDTSVSLKLGFDKDNNGELETNEFLNIEAYVSYVEVTDVNTIHSTVEADGTSCTSSTGGICDFTLKKGDEKAYIKDFVPSSSYPTSPVSGVKFNRVVFFYETGQTPTLQSPSEEISVDANDSDDVSLDSSTITDLENGEEYRVIMANQDQAGNIYYFASSNSSQIKEESVTPALVTGILTEDKCFIATAAYGSLFDSKVKDLRQFRDQFLLTNKLGRAFVKFYYEQSPPLALWITQHNEVRFLVRAFLWPVWAMVYLLNHFDRMIIFLPLSLLLLVLATRRRLQNAS